ncbi:nicotinamide riboside transporter PnuC [Rhizomicrobium electricum]|uniref:Nicotinamide riboside transporter PnuC n=1 Tax=Rhizomicrobium electricum TaxID=480070 RepID=A0ABP3PQD1_9PROT|nr:nicotinamide riboside transporter PnuC [Rhizomicrobium electricum]NIJ47108.1 nicotinamide mononucleotide transporter [Rhizomicrobium electricum]
MATTELIAAGLGLVNVWLVVRRSVWNYPFGLAMVTLYGFVFYDARLYSDTILQGYFFVVQVFGWWYWLKGRDAEGLVRPEILGTKGRLWALGATAAAAAVTGWLFATYTNAAAPWFDAFIAAGSVTGQTLQSYRKVESWLWWIAVDIVAVGVYAWKGLYPTTGLYAIFLVLSVAGLLSWRRQLAKFASVEVSA